MSEDSEQANKGQATPNRGPRRAAATIEGEAVGYDPVREHAQTRADQNRAAPAQARDGAGLFTLLPALAALLIAAASLYYTIIDEPPEPQPSASPEVVAALGVRVERLEGQLAILEARPETQQPAPAPTQTLPDFGPIERRIAAIEAKADSAGAAAGRANERAEALLRQPAPQGIDLTPFEERVAKIEAGLTQAREALAAPKTEMRATEAPNVAAPASSDAAAMAVVTASLLQKIDKGAPIAREIAALEKIGATPADVAALRPLANGGATGMRLAQDFTPLAPAMLRAAHPASGEGDLIDRVTRSAASLVRVRPVGETSGEDAPALISRIESALQRSDIAQAVALFDRLPNEVREPARDWAQRARQRAAADMAIQRMIDTSIERLAGK